jgi:hypothetical protein
MGYKKKVKTFELSFKGDAEYDGLELTMKGLSIGKYLKIAELADTADSDKTADLRPMLSSFADALVSWNMEDEDELEVPASLEGIESLDIEFVMTLISKWLTSVAGVSAPLGSDSGSGETSPELGIPMETK